MQDNKDFREYLETLPPEIKQAIFSIDYPQKLQQIIKNNKLLIDQGGKLEAETTLVMAGIEPLDNYVKNLRENVGLSSIQASVVAHDVDELIFKNIRESLKKINEQIKEEDRILSGAEKVSEPTKEDVLSGIENPKNISSGEVPVSISSQPSSNKSDVHETIDRGIEIKINNLPEIAPKILPSVSIVNTKPIELFHKNTPPVSNIVESKMTSTLIIPKKNIIIEEKTKLPEKRTGGSGDPYRESVI